MEIAFFYTESFTHPLHARDCFRRMRQIGADAVLFNIYEQDLSRWAKDMPRILALAADEGLRRYISPGRFGGVFSGLLVMPSLYSYVHPEGLVVNDLATQATEESQTPMQGFFNRISCVNDPGFRKYMREQLRRMLECLHPEGLLLDEPKGLTLACSCERCRQQRRSGETPEQANLRLQIEFLAELCDLAKQDRPDSCTMLVTMGGDHESLLESLAAIDALDVLGASAYWHARKKDLEWLRTWCPQTVDRVRACGKKSQLWAGNWGLSASEQSNLTQAYRLMFEADPDQLNSFWYWRNNDDPEAVMALTAEAIRTWKSRRSSCSTWNAKAPPARSAAPTGKPSAS